MDPLSKKFASIFSKMADAQIEKMLFDSIENNDVDALRSIIKNTRSTPEQKKRARDALEKMTPAPVPNKPRSTPGF